MFSRGGISSTMQTKLTRRVIISQKDNFIRITLPIRTHDHASAHDNGSVSKAISTLVACIAGEVDRDTLQSLILLPYYRIFPTFSTKTHRKWWACTNFVRVPDRLSEDLIALPDSSSESGSVTSY